jgi:hypothetical protein
MARPIKIKINVSRILKEHLFAGNNGKYLDLVAWPNKNGPDKYGNTHMVCQELDKAARDKGERGPILGNLLLPDDEQQPQRQAPPPAARQQRPAQKEDTGSYADDMEENSIPF